MDIFTIIVRAIPDFFGSIATIVVTAVPAGFGMPIMFAFVGFSFMGMMLGFMNKHKQDVENGN